MAQATLLSSTHPLGERQLSLFRLYDPEVLANPYPFYHHLQQEDPVHWDPFLHAWVVTRYEDVTTVLRSFSAKCAPEPERLAEIGLSSMSEIGRTMVRQMLFMDPPVHTSLRGICSVAFTPHRVESLRRHIQAIVDSLLEPHLADSRIELMGDFANRLPAIVMAEMLGVPTSDHEKLKTWSAQFAEILGNLQHNADSAARTLQSLEEMSNYFQAAIREQRTASRKRPDCGINYGSTGWSASQRRIDHRELHSPRRGRAGDNSQPDRKRHAEPVAPP